jgi:hypothetical protein
MTRARIEPSRDDEDLSDIEAAAFRIVPIDDVPEDCTLDAADLWLMMNDPEWRRGKYK